MEILKMIIKIIKQLLQNANVVPNPPPQDTVEEKPKETNIDSKPTKVEVEKPKEEPKKEEKKVLITEEQFKSLFPRANVKFVKVLNELLPKHKIDTLNRVSSFLAQMGHESNNFRSFIESFNYSATALHSVFSRYFTKEEAKKMGRQPGERVLPLDRQMKIANIVYGGRMDNAPLPSNDGWCFRGRGLIQLTGRYNYTQFGASLNPKLTAEEAIKYCETDSGIIDSAIWYWNTNNLNAFADKDDIRGQSIKINGGENGLPHRTELYEKSKKILKDNFS